MNAPYIHETDTQLTLGRTARSFTVIGLIGAVLFPILIWAKVSGISAEMETPAVVAALASALVCLAMAAYAPWASRKSMFVFDFRRRVVRSGRGQTWLFSTLSCLQLREESLLQGSVFLDLVLRDGHGVALYVVPAYQYDSLKNLGMLLAERLQLQLVVPR